MGEAYGGICKKCGYSFTASLGVGFLFPVVYQDTVQKMKNGELGEFAKKFFEEHPDGAVDCENVVIKCKKCGSFDCAQDLSMYIPIKEREEKTGEWAVAVPAEGIDYVIGDDFDKYYEKYADYPHVCSECDGEAEVVKDFEKIFNSGKMKCPKCGGKFGFDGTIIMWD